MNKARTSAPLPMVTKSSEILAAIQAEIAKGRSARRMIVKYHEGRRRHEVVLNVRPKALLYNGHAVDFWEVGKVALDRISEIRLL